MREMLTPRLTRALPAALALLALAAAPAGAESLRLHPRDLLAHTPAGTQPNAPATDPALSQDGRQVRYAAYTSAATDIAPNTSGVKNVYLVYRRAPWGLDGRRWFEDHTSLLTQGYDGTPANGDSWGPAFDGYDYAHGGREITVASQCLAFVSAASNLVPGDTNGQADVFVKNLKTGKLRRIPTQGPASEVALDGRCFTVAFVAGGTVYTKDIRGKGLMIGIELEQPCSELVQQALEKGVLVNVTVDNVIRLLPPLVMKREEAELLISTLVPLITAHLEKHSAPQAAAQPG